MLKSILRYPGGKFYAVSFLSQFAVDFFEYREAMVGGGSMFLYLRQTFPDRKFWINDDNFDVFCFWSAAQKDSARLTQAVLDSRSSALSNDGCRNLFARLKETDPDRLSDFERAVRFFIMNRICFSGDVAGSANFAPLAVEQNFSERHVVKLLLLKELLAGVKITCGDYADAVREPGKDVLIYLDPPYVTSDKRLYAKAGQKNRSFDYARFFDLLHLCRHRVLVTLDNCNTVKSSCPRSFNMTPYRLRYGMSQSKRRGSGNELAIRNY